MTTLEALCKELKLGDIHEIVESVEYHDRRQYITDLFSKMVELRRNKRADHLIRRAGFPTPATLDQYEFDPITFPSSIDKEGLLSLGFIERKENILMLGSTGTGKTHLSIALGIRACSEGKSVLFYRFARDGESFILRVSPPDESPYVLESSMNYLAEHFSLGSPVVEPVRSINGRLVEEGVSTEGERHLVTVTRVAPGRTHESLARDTISDDLFFEIGRSLAVLHCNLMLIDGRSYGFPEQSRFATLTTPAYTPHVLPVVLLRIYNAPLPLLNAVQSFGDELEPRYIFGAGPLDQ
jgi:hypothetical protein